jgi:hypothetical protein
MDFELKKAKEKWEREQKQRKLEAKARLDREKKAKEEAARLQEALESAQRFRRLEEAQAAAQIRLLPCSFPSAFNGNTCLMRIPNLVVSAAQSQKSEIRELG